MTKPRLYAIGVACVVLAGGLGSRYGLEGFWAKYLGVTLWATCLYTLILAVRPQVSVGAAALLTMGISWLVEFAQLTRVPAYLSLQHIVLRWIFGACFSVWDLPAYVAGSGLGAAIHSLLRRGPLGPTR